MKEIKEISTLKPAIDFHHIMNQAESLGEGEMEKFIYTLDNEKKENFSHEQPLFRLCIAYFFSLSSEERKKIAESITAFDMKHTMSSQILFFVATIKYPYYTGDVLLAEGYVRKIMADFNILVEKTRKVYSDFNNRDTE